MALFYSPLTQTASLQLMCFRGFPQFIEMIRVGYVPTLAAFPRGGYETTFGPSSMLAPEAGERLVETAAALVRRLR